MNEKKKPATVEFDPSQMQFHVEELVDDGGEGMMHPTNMAAYLENRPPKPKYYLGIYESREAAVAAIPAIAAEVGLEFDEENFKWRKK